MDDIVVYYVPQGLQARNKRACFAYPAVLGTGPVPGEFMKREGILPFAAEGDVYLRGGAFFPFRDALPGAAELVVTGAHGNGYQRIRALGNVSFAVRGTRPEDVAGSKAKRPCTY